MNYLRPLIFLLIGAVASLGCDKREAPQSTPQPAQASPTTMAETQPKTEVKVQANGDLFIDGQPTTLDAIDQRFAELAKVKGIVWYYREAGHANPPAVAIEVIKLVVKHRLPISISSKSDFSDTIDNKGVSHLRQTGG